MNLEMVFHHVKKSERVREYAEERLERLERYELKPFAVQFIFSGEGKNKIAELIINGKDRRWVAKAAGENLYQAIDHCIQRMATQLRKKKDKVQKHKKPLLTDAHAYRCLNEQLEWDYSKISSKNRSKVA